MTRPALEALADELCRVFLGWRLREDYEALLALEEGSLHIDLSQAEAWFEGDPLPPLFIASELRSQLEKGLLAIGRSAEDLESAHLDAQLATRPTWQRGAPVPRLHLACHISLRIAGTTASAERNNSTPA